MLSIPHSSVEDLQCNQFDDVVTYFILAVNAFPGCLLTQIENSDVLPPGSVAVAVTNALFGISAGKTILNLALPSGFVVTKSPVRKACPSPFPDGSQAS